MELDWLKQWNQYSPNAIAIKDGETGREYSYREFYRQANIAAQLLKSEFGIKKGDRVAVFATNELEYVFLYFATQRLGAILVPVNFRLTTREVEHIISDCSPRLLIYQQEFEGIVNELSKKPEHTLLFGGPKSLTSMLQALPFTEVPFAGEENDPCMIIYTSGTTGAPKGALLTQKMIFWNSINTTLRLNLSQQDCTVIFLPFFHTGGWNVLTTPFIHRGAKVVFLKKFDGDKILELSEKENATILFGVPTTMDMMARSPLFEKVKLAKMRYAIVGGEPMPVELIKTWHNKGIPVRQGYGLTEFGPNVFSLNEEDAIRKIGSIGFPNFYIEAKVVRDDGSEAGTDEIGELVLKGPSCMAGYWQNEKATASTIVNNWLHTGDLVRKDEEGYFYVVGRKKDMFKSGGENVYPTELEQVLRSLPGVREAAVIGVPDDKWGETGKAFIVKENTDLTVEAVQAHCSKNLAKFKIPKYFSFVESLPKGDSGKILKKKLYEMA
jgi:fatty-acyl-CoA synthase